MKQACRFIYLCKKSGNHDIGLCHVPFWWEEQEDGYLPGCPLTSKAMSMLQYSKFLKKLLTIFLVREDIRVTLSKCDFSVPFRL